MSEYYYPTASTVAVFLNGLHIDQAYRLDYKDNVPKIPIFGYNDYEFTQVARGKGYVQGMLIINFTVAHYLTLVLNSKANAFVPKLYNYQPPSKASNRALVGSIEQSLYNELPPENDSNGKPWTARAEYIATLISNKDSSLKTKVKDALWNFFTKETINANKRRNDDAPIDRELQNPLTITSNGTIGNTIDVYYTDPQASAWFLRFNDVHFYDVSQQISQAGAEGSSEPLYEIYSFLAKNKTIRLL